MTARPAGASRGVADLRTLGGLADKRTPAYKAYLRISFLELERARHGQEIGAVQRRLEFMLRRCQEIDAETSAILASVAPSPAQAKLAPSPARGGAARSLPNDAPAKPRQGRFHVSY